MATQNGKELKFLKWQEKLCQPTKIIDVKDLETGQIGNILDNNKKKTK